MGNNFESGMSATEKSTEELKGRRDDYLEGKEKERKHKKDKEAALMEEYEKVLSGNIDQAIKNLDSIISACERERGNYCKIAETPFICGLSEEDYYGLEGDEDREAAEADAKINREKAIKYLQELSPSYAELSRALKGMGYEIVYEEGSEGKLDIGIRM